VKQLITRIDDDLHRRLKERAAEQDRSLNDLVSSVLAAAVQDDVASLRRKNSVIP
jgi:predicted HicB family RNase H-like nuclease